MAEDNLAQEVEFYDEAETIKASSTMNEQEVENLSGSNVNDNTPKETQIPPKGNTTDTEDVADPQQGLKSQEQIILAEDNLPECIEDLSLDEIFEKCQLAPEKLEELKESHANDNFDDYPTDPEEIVKFLGDVSKSVKEEMLLLKATPMSDEEYNKRYNKLQIKKTHQLLAEFMIGQDLLSIDRQYGVRKKSKCRAEEGKLTKAEVIKQRYPRLGSRQIRDFQHLELKYIWVAIVYAFETGNELTRSLALSDFIKRKANNKPKPLPSNMKRWYAKSEDFETEFKELNLTDEIGATSLFANIGVGTSLLEKHTKIRITVANEWKKRRAKAHQRLYPSCKVIRGSISNEDVFESIVEAHKAAKNKICYISCPCQDSSTFNTSASKGKGERSALFKSALDFVEITRPDYIVFENVPRWLEDRPEFALNILGQKTIGEYVIDELKRLGYNVTVGILSAADYETAENRERAIILACKKELGMWKFPKKHKFRPTVFEIIGLMKSLEAGEVDSDNKWHYGLPLEAHEVEFLRHTPTGCSAWNNAKKYQPKNKDGSPAGAQFMATYTRIDPAYSCNVIESGSGKIGDVHSVHFGRPLSDGTYSDSRVLSIAEILALIGCEADFLEPLNAPGIDEEDFDGLTWENDMLTSPDEDFIREVLGEHVCPKLYNALMTTLPLPANSNNITQDLTVDKTA